MIDVDAAQSSFLYALLCAILLYNQQDFWEREWTEFLPECRWWLSRFDMKSILYSIYPREDNHDRNLLLCQPMGHEESSNTAKCRLGRHIRGTISCYTAYLTIFLYRPLNSPISLSLGHPSPFHFTESGKLLWIGFGYCNFLTIDSEHIAIDQFVTDNGV